MDLAQADKRSVARRWPPPPIGGGGSCTILFRWSGEEMIDLKKRERGQTFICKITMIFGGATRFISNDGDFRFA
jgi:hypothetical protein